MPVYQIQQSKQERESERRRLIKRAQSTTMDDLECIVYSGVMGLGFRKGIEALQEMFGREAEEKCGPKGKHNPGRKAFRHGTIKGKVVMGGAWVEVERPRLRSVDGYELELETYKAAQDPSFYGEAVVSGRPQRSYRKK